MKKKYLLLAFAVLAFAFSIASPATAKTEAQTDVDLVERGKYLVNMAGCISCHTPFVEDAPGQYDWSRTFAGGQPFEVPGVGFFFSKNLTSDEATGIGLWSDEELKTAITTGISRDGLHLFPIMPYVNYSGMADADIEAIIAYLRTLDPIENNVPREQLVPSDFLPQIPPRQEEIIAPDDSVLETRGAYLVHNVMSCSDCHTPNNPETGAPEFDKFLAGGQPFEGPFGIVYGGNITGDEETGIGTWTDQEIKRVITSGVRPDGRVAIVMPWYDYNVISDADLEAVVSYLRNGVEPVSREVPAAVIHEDFLQFSEIESEEPDSAETSLSSILAIAGVLVLISLGVGYYLTQQNKKS